MPEEKPPTNQNVILLVVWAIAVDAFIGMCALSYCMVSGKQPDQTLLTAYVGMTTGLFGVLGGMLSKTSATVAGPTPIQPVTIQQPKTEPVPVEQTP